MFSCQTQYFLAKSMSFARLNRSAKIILNFLRKNLQSQKSCLNLQSRLKNIGTVHQKTIIGSIAQLVQSVCLTSRGSGVRLPLLPQKNKDLNEIQVLYFFAVTNSPKSPSSQYQTTFLSNPRSSSRRSRHAPPGLSRSDWG